MKNKIRLSSFLLIANSFFVTALQSVPTILASTLSCSTPTVVTGSVIVELDVDLVLQGMCEPLQAGITFGPTDTIRFVRGAQGKRIYLASTVVAPTATTPVQVLNPAIWNLSSFSSLGQEFIFDNVELVLDPGTTIMTDALTFRFINGSPCTLQPIT